MSTATMTTVAELCDFLEEFAPAELAAEWDNVGLLVGDRAQAVARVMTCLTITPAVADEAIRERADVIVTHHPLPFRATKRITSDEATGRLLLQLIRGNVAIYSPHTAFDSAAAGINQQFAEGLGLQGIEPLTPLAQGTGGAGRCGNLAQPMKLNEVAARLQKFLGISGLHIVGSQDRLIQRAAIACGSAGEFLPAAVEKQCDLLITGETNLHTCYEAEARGIALLLPGHYASERFGVENLAKVLQDKFPALQMWASRDERDPLTWLS